MSKLLLLMMMALTLGSVHAGDYGDDLPPNDPGHRDPDTYVARVHGQVNFGPYINCEITNNEPYSHYQILHYNYQISYVDQWNQVRVGYHQLACGFGCDVAPYRTVRLSGPRNGVNVIGARCSATVRVYDYSQGPGDGDYPILSGGADINQLN